MIIPAIESTTKGVIEFSRNGRGSRMVVVVHGGHVDCRETLFQKGFDLDTFCFITPSRPGYGKTPLTSENRSPKGTADLIVALLDKLHVDNVAVIGVSAGGLTAIELAANYPERVHTLILMSAVTKKWFRVDDRVYKGGKVLFDPRIELLTWSVYRLAFKIFPKTMANVMFKQLSTYRPATISKYEFNEIKELTVNMRSRSGFVNDLDQDIDSGLLQAVSCKCLIMHSDYDHAVDKSHPLNAKKWVPQSELLLFGNRWGHMLWIGEDYNSVLTSLLEYLR